MSSTRTVVLEGHPRANSMSSMEVREMRSSQFLSRTSMFFKKVTLFRPGRRKSEERRASATMMPRSARSVDMTMAMGNKAFGMSQPVLSVNADRSMTDNEDHSDASTSPTQPRSRPPSSLSPSQSAPPFISSEPRDPNGAHSPLLGLPPVDLGTSRINIDGLPRSPELTPDIAAGSPAIPPAQPENSGNEVPVSDSAVSGLSDSTSSESYHSVAEQMCPVTGEPLLGSPAKAPIAPPTLIDSPKSPLMKFNPGTPMPHYGLIDTSSSLRAQSLPSRNLVSPNATPSLSNVNSTPAATFATPALSEQGTPRAAHPRLASLPPPMIGRYATRLTPSIAPRPMPILNLPTLPPPTPLVAPTAAQMSSPMRLRSMPALPMRGPSDLGVVAAEHETAALDEMDEVMEDEEEDEEGAAGPASDEEASSPSLEVPGMGRRLRSPLPPSLSRSPRMPADLPAVDTSPLDTHAKTSAPHVPGEPSAEAQRATMYFTPTEPVPPTDILRTPIFSFRKVGTPNAPATTDYFSSKLPEAAREDSTRTPRPTDYDDLVAPKTVPMPHMSPRPGLYNQASKSMINLLTTNRLMERAAEVDAENRKSRAPDYMVANTRDTPKDAAGPTGAASGAKGSPHTLRRQRSLPMYNPASEPPPYPTFHPHQPPVPQPREEEGMERLPTYTNSIYLAAVMPRKQEFHAPGFQSKDRKWKRTLCILEGTMFKVYRIHNGVVEDWWERTVGAGDKTSIDPSAVSASGGIRVSGVHASERLQEPSKGELAQAEGSSAPTAAPAPTPSTNCVPPSQSRSKLHSLLHPRSHRLDKNMPCNSNMGSRMSLDTSRDDMRPSTSSSTPRRQSMDSMQTTSPTASTSGISTSRRRQSSDDTSISSNQRSSSGSSPSSAQPAISHFSMLSASNHMPIPEPDPKDLIRKYSLQSAESGLASDYIKRKNVIRVRMEGEQFLLQARDVPAVIEWIEGIQAATNIALDLDERPMPKGPMFPRRRRRRVRRTEATANGQSSSNATNDASGSTARPS